MTTDLNDLAQPFITERDTKSKKDIDTAFEALTKLIGHLSATNIEALEAAERLIKSGRPSSEIAQGINALFEQLEPTTVEIFGQHKNRAGRHASPASVPPAPPAAPAVPPVAPAPTAPAPASAGNEGATGNPPPTTPPAETPSGTKARVIGWLDRNYPVQAPVAQTDQTTQV